MIILLLSSIILTNYTLIELNIKQQRRMLDLWHTVSWRRFRHVAIDVGIHKISPHQIVARTISTICRHMQNFVCRQNSVPHVYIVNLAIKALHLLKTIPIIILILAKDKNAISANLKSC